MKTQTIIRALAVLVLCTVVQAQPQDGALLDRATALAEARSGKWERAEAALEALAGTVPADPEVCAQLVLRRLEQKRHKEAVELAERAAEAAPDSAGLQSLLGRALGARINELAFIQQGFVAPKMLRAFKRSVELDPNHVPGLIGLASYYLYSPAIAGGSFARAEEFARKVEALDPFNGARLRAEINERQGKWSEAAERYRDGIKVQPKNAWLQAQLGNALAKAGERAGAKSAFEAALQLQPDLAQAQEGLRALGARAED